MWKAQCWGNMSFEYLQYVVNNLANTNNIDPILFCYCCLFSKLFSLLVFVFKHQTFSPIFICQILYIIICLLLAVLYLYNRICAQIDGKCDYKRFNVKFSFYNISKIFLKSPNLKNCLKPWINFCLENQIYWRIITYGGLLSYIFLFLSILFDTFIQFIIFFHL